MNIPTYKALEATSKAKQQAAIKSESNQKLIRKLQLSIVIPVAIVLVIFSLFIYDLNHKSDMQNLTKKPEIASGITKQYYISSHLSDDANVSDQQIATADQIFEEMIADTEMFLYHNSSGQHFPLAVEKGLDNQALMSAILARATKSDFSTQQTIRGMLMVDHKSYIFLSVPVESSGTWLTSIMNSPTSHSIFDLLLSVKFIIIILAVLLLGVLSSSYIIKSFIKKVDENADMLRYRGTHDALTDLPNRHLINTIVQHNIDGIDPNTQSVTLFMIDVVGFRDINDTLGNTLGDELLFKLSGLIKTIEPHKTDVVRMGADVFCLVCKLDQDTNDVHVLANMVHDCLEAKQELNGVPIVVQSRVGISMFPSHSIDAEELVRFANIALAQAKIQNTTTCYYHTDQNTHSIRKLTLLARLSSAIKNDKLTLVYQPKFDLHQSKIVGVEVLVRWHDDEYGHISPIEFVHWAEISGLINNLTHWVLRAAEKQCALWRAQGCYLPFAINLSPTNLYDAELVPLVSQLLKDGSFSAELLELELTEDAVMEDPETALETMKQLSDLGVTFAIDDFGTGHSSFAYLQKFPVTNLKIDRGFIKNIDHNEHDAVLALSMINLGHELGCVVTGEGVEDVESLEKLRAFGCDHIQGYYISKPLPADEFMRWYIKGQYLPDIAA